MKFLLDVNVGGALSPTLLKLDHDIACVADVNPRLADSTILEWAVKEERAIITTDSDFEQMIWLQEKSHYGVLRLENLPRMERIVLLRSILAAYAQELEAGVIIIATQKKVRIGRKITDD